jgi:hypothetical protein
VGTTKASALPWGRSESPPVGTPSAAPSPCDLGLGEGAFFFGVFSRLDLGVPSVAVRQASLLMKSSLQLWDLEFLSFRGSLALHSNSGAWALSEWH